MWLINSVQFSKVNLNWNWNYSESDRKCCQWRRRLDDHASACLVTWNHVVWSLLIDWSVSSLRGVVHGCVSPDATTDTISPQPRHAWRLTTVPGRCMWRWEYVGETTARTWAHRGRSLCCQRAPASDQCRTSTHTTWPHQNANWDYFIVRSTLLARL